MSILESLKIKIEMLKNLEELENERITEPENLEIEKLGELKRKTIGKIAIENLERIEIEKQEIAKRKNSQFNKQITCSSKIITLIIFFMIRQFINKTSKTKNNYRKMLWNSNWNAQRCCDRKKGIF